MSFNNEYDKKKQYIDTLVERYASEFSSPSKVLTASVKYSASTGGKRLRAILALEFFEFFGGKADTSMEIFLAAIELLHLYTLVHDDLPCMDNDDYRRGLKTNHKVFGEGMALLCGDALLNYAYELLFKAAMLSSNKSLFIDVCAVFSTYVGGYGVIGGQALEFEEGRLFDAEHTVEIYEHKTCDLICAVAVAGAMLAGANDNTIRLCEKFGYHFGIAFQIRDDFLDIKEKGQAEKNSLVGLIGEENANSILEENINAALSCLDLIGNKSEFIRELTGFAARRSI